MKTFLIVDDSAFMRMSIRNVLVKNGYKIIGEADNGKAGIEKYKELMPDMVTLDITMDKMSGLDTLKEIMRYDPDAKVLMVSAMGQDTIIKEAMDAGAKGFLTKPFKKDRVASVVAALYRQLEE